MVFSQQGVWYYPTNTHPYPQDESTAMTFGIRSANDRGCLYVLFRHEENTVFRAYNQANNEWQTLEPLSDIPEWGSAICAWHNQNSIPQEYKVFAIPYDISGDHQRTGHIYEYDIPTNTWTILDTVPHNRNKGHGLSLKTGNTDGTYINLYYLGGWASDAERNDGFWVYRRLLKPAGPRGNPVKSHWEKLVDFVHGYGADLAFWPDAYNGNQIFALRGGESRLFYVYDIARNNWTQKHVVPGYVRSGGSLAGDGILGSEKVPSNSDRLYAFEGVSSNNWPRNDFHQYHPSADLWNDDFDPPDPNYGVGRGADLAFGYWDSPGDQKEEFGQLLEHIISRSDFMNHQLLNLKVVKLRLPNFYRNRFELPRNPVTKY